MLVYKSPKHLATDGPAGFADKDQRPKWVTISFWSVPLTSQSSYIKGRLKKTCDFSAAAYFTACFPAYRNFTFFFLFAAQLHHHQESFSMRKKKNISAIQDTDCQGGAKSSRTTKKANKEIEQKCSITSQSITKPHTHWIASWVRKNLHLFHHHRHYVYIHT